jgi:hypothetical protein
VGPQGPSGKTILNGTAAPTSSDGSDGDFYLRTSTSTLYGPKAGGIWPSGVSLVGPAGADGSDGVDGVDGADGRTVLGGSGPPNAGVGLDGDFYIDQQAWVIYGPKASGVWGSGTSLVGEKGDQGDPGAPGGQGPVGPQWYTTSIVDGQIMIEIEPTNFGVDDTGRWYYSDNVNDVPVDERALIQSFEPLEFVKFP